METKPVVKAAEHFPKAKTGPNYTITIRNEKEGKEYIFKLDELSFMHSRGWNVTPSGGKINLNGQETLTFQGCVGCRSFQDFERETVVETEVRRTTPELSQYVFEGDD